MYRLFFCKRTTDRERVGELLVSLKKVVPNLLFEDVSEDVPDAEDWKEHATPLLDGSDGVVCIVGPETHASEPIDWEIREAHRLGKPLMVAKLAEQYLLPEACKALQIEPMPWESVKVAARIGELVLPKALFRKYDSATDAGPPREMFGQYRLMVESWETLLGRRQSVNTLYVSANAALLAAIGGLVSAENIAGPELRAAGVMVLAFLGFFLSLNWRRTVTSYGLLSAAKAKVVQAIEEHLPAKLFDAEWKILESTRYHSTTKLDKQTALFFVLLFFSVFALACGVVGVNLLPVSR